VIYIVMFLLLSLIPEFITRPIVLVSPIKICEVQTIYNCSAIILASGPIA
jgi:hypothetical protein